MRVSRAQAGGDLGLGEHSIQESHRQEAWRPHRVLDSAQVSGRTIHGGGISRLSIEPSSGSGIEIIRVDKDKEHRFVLEADRVVATNRATTLGYSVEGGVCMMEHCLASLAAFGIQNCRLRVEGDELPIFDGSASSYMDMIVQAGVAEVREADVFEISKDMVFDFDGSTYYFSPAAQPYLEVVIDFPHPGIGRQSFGMEITAQNFQEEVARARTFGFVHEHRDLCEKSLGKGSGLDTALVFGESSALNKGGLRFKNECARHKWLDVLGDLYCLGRPLFGRIVVTRPGHFNNHRAVMALLRESGGLRHVSKSFEPA